MRILDVAVRDYRRLKDCRIEFAAGATVIGGPNETGKSTLAEAMHRALFLRARGTGQAWKEMQPVGGGTPQVEIRFLSRGATWRLVKRFAGAGGSTSLTRAGGAELRDDEAEAKLAELLGVEAAGGGRGGASEATRQWAHLWVWQGGSGSDPVEHANARRDTLLPRLRRDGAAAAMQSEADGRVAARIAERHEAIFLKNGQPKKDSDLARAREELARAQAEVSRRRESLERLAEAARSLTQAEAALKALDESLVALKAQRAELAARAKAAEAGTAEVNALERKTDEARRAHEELLQTERRIGQTKAEIARQAEALVPLERAVAALEAEAAAARASAEGAEIALRDAETRARDARLARELSEAWLHAFEREEEKRRLEERFAQVGAHRARRDALEAELAKCPAADARTLKNLRALDQARGIAEAELAAVAAGVELLAADLPVFADGAPLARGERRVFFAQTEIRVGDTVRLRLSPGGGAGLEEQRGKAEEARRKFARALEALALPSLSAVEEAVERRRALEKSRDEEQAALSALKEEAIERDLARAQTSLAHARTEAERRAQAVPGMPAPADLAAARESVERMRDAASEAETQEKTQRKVRQNSSERIGELEKDVVARRGERDAAASAKSERDAVLKDLLATNGDDAARAGRVAVSAAALERAERDLAAARERLALLQPETILKNRERFDRALEQNSAARSEADAARISARTLLTLDGSNDPHADLAVALEREVHAAETVRRETTAAEAVRMLHNHFQEATRKLAEEITGPLLERIAGYLEQLFGKGARAVLSYERGAFEGLALHRPGAADLAFPFERLSGGAKEQAAAAVRLALAEILAQGEDGTLPILFDDAFAFSDPERVATLQGMLDLACERGLQVIVLTCNPADYAALGAKPVTIDPGARPSLAGEVFPRSEHAPRPSEDHAEPRGEDPDEGRPPFAPPAADETGETAERLLAALRACGGKSGNTALRQTLGLDEAAYDAVKRALVAKGLVILGKGRGGSVALA